MVLAVRELGELQRRAALHEHRRLHRRQRSEVLQLGLPGGLRTRHCLGLLFVAVFGAYFNALGNGLVDFDDAVVLNPAGAFGIAGVLHLAESLRAEPLRVLPLIVEARPLSGLTHLLDSALYGEDYWGHHLGNVLLHFVACVFAFLAASEVLGSKARGLAAALLFALHPVQTESVAYLAGRRDVLYGMLSLASLSLWLRALRTGCSTAPAAGLWALAMLAKPAAITLPLLWLAGAAAARPAEVKAHLVRHLKLYAGCAAASAAVLLAALAGEATNLARFELPAEVLWYGGAPAEQWATEPRIVLHALKLLLWPAKLSADYSLNVFEPSRSFFEPAVLFSLAVCGGFVALAWALRKRAPAECFALAWIGATYAPMIHVFPTLHNHQAFAEHWLYLPVFGWALLLTSLLQRLRAPSIRWAVLGLILCLYAGRTAHRNQDWKDPLTLWSRTVEAYSECGRAQGSLGLIQFKRGDRTAAEAALRRALELRPDDPKHYINLAVLLRSDGRVAEAERILLRAGSTPLAKPMRDDLEYNLDLLYAQSGQLQKASRLDDEAAGAPARLWTERSLNLAGMTAAARGDRVMAETAYLRALALSRDPAVSLNNLAFLYFSRRNFGLAAHAFERLLRHSPSHFYGRVYLGLSYLELRQDERARRALDQALREAPRSTEVWLALSSFHLKRGELPRALAAARQAERLERSPRVFRQLYSVYREM